MTYTSTRVTILTNMNNISLYDTPDLEEKVIKLNKVISNELIEALYGETRYDLEDQLIELERHNESEG